MLLSSGKGGFYIRSGREWFEVKRTVLFFSLVLALAAAVIFSLSMQTSPPPTTYGTITAAYANYKLNIDGNPVVPRDAAGNRVEIFSYNGTTYLPVRAAANALNKNVTWDGSTNTIYLTDKPSTDALAGTNSVSSEDDVTGKTGTEAITVAYMSIKIDINGTVITPKDGNGTVVEPFLYNGTTYLPVRAIGTAFGKSVGYDNASKTISLASDQLRVSFLDVGQGDSIFIELPDRETMLIDAGNADNGEDIVNYIKDHGYDTIDYLVATHPHADHIGGMAYVVKNLSIQSVYMPKAGTTTRTYENLLKTIQEQGLSVHTAKAGVSILDTGDLKADILAPNKDSYEDLNNDSAVIKITYGTRSFLFMGDAETLSENEITADVKADVLKVGHHGSTSSTGRAFLAKVDPAYAVISVGADNDYGHPAEETLEKLSAVGASIYRTDRDGTVVFTTDGTTISVNK